MHKIIMPPGGQTTDESVIFSWQKKVGDKIEIGDVLFEIETDKTVLEVESFCGGWLRAVKYAEGETVPVGETVAYVGEADEPMPEGENMDSPDVPIEAKITETKKQASPILKQPERNRILASPLAKKIAREHNIELKIIAGAGKAGVIKKRDVLDYISKPKKFAADHIPCHAVGFDVDMTSCAMFLERLDGYLGGGREKESRLEDIIAKCAARAAKKFLPANSDIKVVNFEMFGADWCAPAITPPESCVLAFGAIKEKAASLNREIVSRDMMSLTASFDCREIDAESGARFLAEVKKLLESPELFVLAMAM